MSDSVNIGHGHVYPRPDGILARCGGPGICPECSADLATKTNDEARRPYPLVMPEDAEKIVAILGEKLRKTSEALTELRKDTFDSFKRGEEGMLSTILAAAPTTLHDDILRWAGKGDKKSIVERRFDALIEFLRTFFPIHANEAQTQFRMYLADGGEPGAVPSIALTKTEQEDEDLFFVSIEMVCPPKEGKLTVEGDKEYSQSILLPTIWRTLSVAFQVDSRTKKPKEDEYR